LKVQQNGVYLDLATGTGYVGFKIAEQFSGCSVVGLDIADEVISENLMKVKERGLSNIEFRIYDGIAFPNFRTKFDGVICRYALHHFPKIHGALGEIKRVLKDNGRVIIADAIRNEHDKEDFINKFQGLKKDGHVRMYTRDEILSLFRKHNFIEEEYFDSKITFSRELSPPYEDLLKATSPKIKEKYFVKVDKSKVTLTFDILNVTFIKKA
jgi:ubiquinone/menaquinone biosynthesis C-methylase UbiE